MFAARENIIPHFEFISSVDHGTDVNWKVRACERIVKKAMASTFFEIDEYEARILRGAKVNLGLDAEDFHLVFCLDLHSVELSEYGRCELIDYLAELTSRHFFYAQSQQKPDTKKKKKK